MWKLHIKPHIFLIPLAVPQGTNLCSFNIIRILLFHTASWFVVSAQRETDEFLEIKLDLPTINKRTSCEQIQDFF